MTPHHAHDGDRIEAAAVRFEGVVYMGDTHKHAAMCAAAMLDLTPRAVWEMVEAGGSVGFVTSRKEFLSRAEAWPIALVAGQVSPNRRHTGGLELTSEDLIGGRLWRRRRSE